MTLLKKDDGGILILLVYVIGIVLVLSATVMSTTVMSYKMRLSNITYVSNAYMSDGGLDEANALAIMSYEETCTATMEHITEIMEGTAESIEKINAGEQNYILSPYRKYIHPLNLTLLQDEIKREYESCFIKVFKDVYTGRINDFHSEIDEKINIMLKGIEYTSGKSIYSMESSYSKKGITRKNSVELTIIYPEISFDDEDNVEIVHHDAPVSRNNWRVLYGQ